MTDTADLIIARIEKSELDDDVNRILETAGLRSTVLRTAHARRNMSSMDEGDHVRIKDDAPLKPRYIRGATGTIEEKRISKMVVRMDDDIHDPYGKWAGKRAVIDAAHLEPVE